MAKTAFREPEYPFQSAGDICNSCKPFWRSQGLRGYRFVDVVAPDGGVMRTENRGIEIAICPHCDGDLILTLKK